MGLLDNVSQYYVDKWKAEAPQAASSAQSAPAPAASSGGYKAGETDVRGKFVTNEGPFANADYYDKYYNMFNSMSNEQLSKYANWHYDPFAYQEGGESDVSFRMGPNGFELTPGSSGGTKQYDNQLWSSLDPNLAIGGDQPRRFDVYTQAFSGEEKDVRDRQTLANIAAYVQDMRSRPAWQQKFFEQSGGYGTWVTPTRGNQTTGASFAQVGDGKYKVVFGEIPGNTPQEKLDYVKNNPETDLWMYDLDVSPDGSSSNITGAQYYEGQDVGGEGWEVVTNIVGGLLSLIPGGQLLGPAIIAGGQLGSAANNEKPWGSALLGAGMALAGPALNMAGVNTTLAGEGGLLGSTGSSLADKAISGAATGLVKSGVSQAVQGQFDPTRLGIAAAQGAASGAIGDVINEYAPEGWGGLMSGAANAALSFGGKALNRAIGGSSGGQPIYSGSGAPTGYTGATQQYSGSGTPASTGASSGGGTGARSVINTLGSASLASPTITPVNIQTPQMVAAMSDPSLQKYQLGWNGYGDFSQFQDAGILQSLKDYIA